MLDRVLWLLLAAGHLLPALPAAAPSLLQRLYGVAPDGDIGALLRHRAVLFGVIVVIAGWAAFSASVRPLAWVACSLSVVGFVAVYLAAGSPIALRQIFVVDAALLIVLGLLGWRVFAPQ